MISPKSSLICEHLELHAADNRGPVKVAFGKKVQLMRLGMDDSVPRI
jgi:hypothetical protein